jgi:hypothetical protein
MNEKGASKMNFFDYLFCRLYWWNTQIIKETDILVVYCVFGLSAFQTFSIMPIYMSLYVLKICTDDIEKLNRPHASRWWVGITD